MTTRPKKNNFTLISPQNVTPFLFGPIDVFLDKFEMILHMPFFLNNSVLQGLLADIDQWFSDSNSLQVFLD